MPPRRQSPLSETVSIFVNREGLIERFENELLRIPTETSSLLVFYGQGGQGKTQLCRELIRRTDFRVNPNFDFIKIAHLDLHEKMKTDPDRALIWIRNAFAAQDLSFPTFDLAFLYYWEKVRKEESLPGLINALLHNSQDVVGDAGTDIGQFLGDLWQDAIDTIPGVKTIYKWAGKKAVKVSHELWLKMSRPETLRAMFDEVGQVREAHIIKKQLPWYLAQDLNHYLSDYPQCRFVLMIDEYERIALEGGASTVIQENPFDKIFQQFIIETNGLLSVFFTRERLIWENDHEWKNDLVNRQFCLEGLKDCDAEKWLKLEGITDEKILEAMIDGARETSDPEALIYPLLLDLQIEHYHSRVSNEQKISSKHFSIFEPDFKSRCQKLLERVLRDYGEPMQATLKRLCVTERFDKDDFSYVISKFKTGLSLERFERIRKLSFITQDDNDFLLIHRAIRDLMLSWLDNDYKLETVNLLLPHFIERSSFDPIIKSPTSELIALNQALELRLFQDPKGISSWLQVLEEPFLHRGKYADLEAIWLRVLGFLEKKPSNYSKDIAVSYNQVALNLQAQGRYSDSELFYKKSLEIYEQVLGDKHTETAGIYSNFAINLDSQGRYDEAEALLKKSLDVRIQNVGEEHTDTANSYNNLASNLDSQGRYEEAELFYKKSLEIYKQILGEEHSYNEAEPLLKKCLEIRERILGEDHLDTAYGLNNLASNLESQGRYGEAEPLLKRSLEIREQILGEEHPDTANSLNSLASVLNSQGRYKDADLIYRKSLEIRERVLGENHPATASSYNNAGYNLNALGRYDDAEPLFKKGLQIRERILGENHPATATSYGNLASNLQSQKRYKEAELLCKKGIEIRGRILSDDHPDTANGFNSLASILNAQGRYEEAELLYKKCLEIRKRVLGIDHPKTATSYNNVGYNLTAQGKYKEAELLYKKSLKIREKTLGENHPDTATSYGNVASILNTQGRYKEAELLFKKICERLLGPLHPRSILSRENYNINKRMIK